MKREVVSVVITTRNEQANIANCLESVLRQDYPKELIEIIVVDNNSSDSTKSIASRFTDKFFNFGPERSAQRNFGVSNSKGQYILYLDADMSLSEKVVRECVEKCERNGLVALYIPERIVGHGFWIKVRNFERSFYNATCIDCVRFVRRDTFLQIGGFDESLTGPEDWDFDRRIKERGRVDIIESEIFHNEGQFSLRNYTRKKAYYSRTFDLYVSKWGKGDPITKKQLGLWYRYFIVFWEQGKWKRIFAHPALAAGTFFLRFMVGAVYIMR